MKAPTVLITSTAYIPRTVVACLAPVFETTIGFSAVAVRFATMTNMTLIRQKPSGRRGKGHDQSQARVGRRIEIRKDPGRGGNRDRESERNREKVSVVRLFKGLRLDRLLVVPETTAHSDCS